MKAVALVAAAVLAASPSLVGAQQGSESVFLEELTWTEVRDLVQDGYTSVIIATGGTEQKGPHMVDGEHRFVLEYTTDRIARLVGNTLVAPIVTYVPEGSWENPRGHMAMAGTITLPEPWFVEMLEHAARSLAAGGFTDILFIGDSGGNQRGMQQVVAALNESWQGTGRRAHFIGDYYGKSGDDIRSWMVDELGVDPDDIGGHAGMTDTSQQMFVNPAHIRLSEMAPGGGFEGSGVSGDPTRASAALGEGQLRIKIDNAVAQIRESLGVSGPTPDPDRRLPKPELTPFSEATGGPFIERLTWTEIRDAIADGATTAIVPVGGTEQNGPHMVLGKHNYIITHAAELMAEALGNTLVAPTLAYVPEGDHQRPGFGDKPGVITNPGSSYEQVLEAAARSLRVHGITDILFIGDSGGNQAGMQAVADRLNREWAGTGTTVYALTDYYRKGQEHTRAWLMARHGYTPEEIGSHAGIMDTSQVLYVYPEGIRMEKAAPFGGFEDSGVRGDPTKATADIGRMGVRFKVNAGLEQYRELRGEGGRR
ncbi:MAG: creatininase family protein [Gemmatimonadetes bacterium]|nr:creatininase family protein [Gemmatimonadota bacterium]